MLRLKRNIDVMRRCRFSLVKRLLKTATKLAYVHSDDKRLKAHQEN